MNLPAQTERRPADRERDRGELRRVIAMAVPVVITTGSRAFMDIADYFMITRLNLPAAQAAILPGQLIMWAYIVIGLGIVSMANTLAAQSLGGGRYRECGAYAWQTVYVAGMAGVAALLLRAKIGALIALIGHEPAVGAQELAYARVAVLTVGPTVAAAGLGAFFIGIHRPWITTWSVIEANVVNVAVSFVLIFGHLGFDRMGIAGAAWGTFVAVCYRTTRLTLTLLMPALAERFSTRDTWRPSWPKIRKYLRLGLPYGVQWFSEVIVWAIFVNILVGTKFGTAHLIATNIAWQYLRISFLPTLGVGQALTALVGRSIGAGDARRAIREARIAARITFTYMGSLSLAYWVCGEVLIEVFTMDPEVVGIGRAIMICAGVFQLFDAIGIAYESALRGAGDTLAPAAFFITSNWVILVGCGYLVAEAFPQLGSLGPWIVGSSMIGATATFLWWRWHSRAWMKIDLALGAGSEAGLKSPA